MGNDQPKGKPPPSASSAAPHPTKATQHIGASSGLPVTAPSVPYTSYSQDTTSTAGDDPYKIITVVENNRPVAEDLAPELDMLYKIPRFQPFVKTSSWPFGNHETTFGNIPARPLLTLCAEHQSHLRKASSIVSGQQKALGTKIKQQESRVALSVKVLQHTVEQVKLVELKIREVERLRQQLEAAKSQIEALMAATEELSCVLPTADRMTSLYFYLGPRKPAQAATNGAGVPDEQQTAPTPETATSAKTTTTMPNTTSDTTQATAAVPHDQTSESQQQETVPIDAAKQQPQPEEEPAPEPEPATPPVIQEAQQPSPRLVAAKTEADGSTTTEEPAIQVN
eukprot:TRINITY_DN15115_c0_g1_i1.p1 TRINITY_DN15115_c0_g1~~TRINITY_DN15115_c0_g1_i1.p1  ORF type:complete len:339 (-),score=63.81 TRINITY_DN15115_c0_g1_i1:38-1054(-)